MYEKRFTATLGPDRTIRVPDDIPVQPGPVIVTVVPELAPGAVEALRDRMAHLADELNSDAGLPPDLAENHDHYLHGTPKGIDRQ